MLRVCLTNLQMKFMSSMNNYHVICNLDIRMEDKDIEELTQLTWQFALQKTTEPHWQWLKLNTARVMLDMMMPTLNWLLIIIISIWEANKYDYNLCTALVWVYDSWTFHSIHNLGSWLCRISKFDFIDESSLFFSPISTQKAELLRNEWMNDNSTSYVHSSNTGRLTQDYDCYCFDSLGVCRLRIRLQIFFATIKFFMHISSFRNTDCFSLIAVCCARILQDELFPNLKKNIAHPPKKRPSFTR